MLSWTQTFLKVLKVLNSEDDDVRLVMVVKKMGVLVTDRLIDGQTDIGGCRVTFATKNQPVGKSLILANFHQNYVLLNFSYYFSILTKFS